MDMGSPDGDLGWLIAYSICRMGQQFLSMVDHIAISGRSGWNWWGGQANAMSPSAVFRDLSSSVVKTAMRIGQNLWDVFRYECMHFTYYSSRYEQFLTWISTHTKYAVIMSAYYSSQK